MRKVLIYELNNYRLGMKHTVIKSCNNRATSASGQTINSKMIERVADVASSVVDLFADHNKSCIISKL